MNLKYPDPIVVFVKQSHMCHWRMQTCAFSVLYYKADYKIDSYSSEFSLNEAALKLVKSLYNHICDCTVYINANCYIADIRKQPSFSLMSYTTWQKNGSFQWLILVNIY